MDEKASEKSPFYLVAALYGAVVAVGFGSDTPPLGATGLFLAALTLVVFGHVFHAYQIASTKDDYPSRQFALDFALIAVLAIMFNMLAHPISGGFLRFLRPWVTGEEFMTALGSNPRAGITPQEQVRNTFFHFFGLSFIALVLLIAWHVSMPTTFKFKAWWPYVLGWTAFGIISAIGLCKTASPSPDINVMFAWLNWLGVASITGAALLLVFAKVKKWTYEPVAESGPPQDSQNGGAGEGEAPQSKSS